MDAVSSSPERVADELFSAGLIPKEVRDKARIAAFSSYEKASHLFPAVEAKILADSSCQDFEKLCKVLSKLASTKELSTRMMEEYSKLVARING